MFYRALVSSLFAIIIPYFLAAFVAFGFLRFLFFKTGLDNPQGYGKEFQSREHYLREIGLELDQSYKPSVNES